MEKWNKRFDGISSFSVSEKLGIDHRKVRETFKNFRRQNKGTLTDNVILRPFEVGKDVVTTVFFPSKESLKESFSKSNLATKHIPEFKKRLYLGHRRNELAYFSQSVLAKYFDLAEKFNIQDSLFGGFLTSRPDSSEDESHQEKTPVLRFGKRKLDKNEQVVAAILEDLAALPEDEQQHWHFSEIEHPNFSLFDPDFHKYYLRYYDVIPIHKRDPLNRLLSTLKKINALPNVGRLFNNLDGVHLQYPVKKSFEDFITSCDLLYKIIGPDNLNTDVLKNYLHSNYNYRHNHFRDSRGEPLNNSQLFRAFLKEIGFLENSIDKLLNSLKEHAIPPDHQINALRSGTHDFLSEFRNLCQSLLISYTILYEKLKA
ncbi:MAG TPA: hypothetical protein VFG39_07575 [Balneolaceae bacterium]|nr:hypothetical protein [Balneolaceae bacterium]